MVDGWISMLDLLSGQLPDDARWRQEAARRLRARTLRIRPGPFEMTAIASPARGWAGLLVVDGLLLAELAAGRARVGWLLGSDDLICPWEVDGGLTRAAAWRSLKPTRVALLDAEFARRAAPVPGVMPQLLSRSQRTSRWLLAKSLLVSSPIVEERVMFLFALLGERWGKVTPEGVRLDLRLTHALVALLVGARRPTVTATLTVLQQKGIVKREAGGGWLLCPGDTVNRSSSWQEYARALGCW
jgi:CRP/FNR family cyclic AMP-dependent transcriptional regulator